MHTEVEGEERQRGHCGHVIPGGDGEVCREKKEPRRDSVGGSNRTTSWTLIMSGIRLRVIKATRVVLITGDGNFMVI